MTTKTDTAAKATKTTSKARKTSKKKGGANTQDAIASAAVLASAPTIMIRLSDLRRDPDNIRKSEGKIDKAMLASLQKHGLIHALVVTANADTTYTVRSGNRRLEHLLVLADTGKIAPDAEISCQVREASPEDITDMQLAENTHRENMHPVDEYEAFARLSEQGLSQKEIANRHGIGVKSVKARFALGRAHPEIREAAREGKIELNALATYANCPDTDRQLEAFQFLGTNSNSYVIRQTLEKGGVRSDAALVKFVGLDAYLEAGGHLQRNLLEDGGLLTDLTLLEELRDTKLREIAQACIDDGYKWADVSIGDHSVGHGLDRHYPHQVPMTDEEQARYDELKDKLQAENQTNEERFAISQEIRELNNRPRVNTDEEKAISGCFVIYSSGRAYVEKGYVLASDAPDATEDTDEASGSANAASEGVNAPDAKPMHNKSFEEDLSVFKTQALKAALVDNPTLGADLAQFTLIRKIRGTSDMRISNDTRLSNVTANEPYYHVRGELTETEAARVLERAYDDVPDAIFATDAIEAFQAFQALPDETRRLALTLAFVDTMERCSRANPIEETLVVAQTEATLRDYYTPTVENYFERQTKGNLLNILDHLLGESRSQLVGNSASKPDVVDVIARLFRGEMPGLPEDAKERVRTWTPEKMAFGSGEALGPTQY